ncbi:MAG: L,D-transpeptidase family protein [Fusicatenibacter sp.]|nr:L,D-transpeptidase family protein [Fusicatenibacter sp.]
MKKKKSTAKSVKRAVLTAVGGICLAGAGIYLGVGYYYSSHFFPQTVINGLNCAGLTVEQVKSKIQSRILEYSLTIKERGGAEDVLTGDQIGLTYVDDNMVEQVLEDQNAWSWPMTMMKRKTYQFQANSVYDKEKLFNLLGALTCFQDDYTTAPTDAYITDNGTSYEIIPETQGNRLNGEAAKQVVADAVDNGETEVDFEEEDLYIKPEIYSDNEALNREAEQLNLLTNARITYDFVDRSYTVDRALIQSWLIQDEEGNYGIDEASAADWVRQMAYETDTFGLAHSFKTSLGPTIELKAGGDYGWCINKSKTTESLIEAIKAGVVENRDPVYLYSGKDRSSNDIGDTYVEVCISEQTMWCYKDGVLVSKTPVVTGSHATGYDTPAGSVWAVDAKKRDYDFTLYDAHVMFWMPFNGNVGIHDSSWRSEYGGEIYLDNGSHGCVNTPYDEAEKIYNSIEIGDPVIVYYSLNDVVGPQPTQENGI